MAFRSGMELSLLLTPPVSAPSLAPASRGPELTVSRASPFGKQRGESVATPTPSYRARRDATSSYSLLRLVADGGRWGSEPATFLRLLARARAARAHAAVRSALRAAYVSRWSSIIAVAAQRAPPALCSSSPSTPSPLLPANRPCMRSCKMNAGSTPLRPADFRPGPNSPPAPM